MSTTTETAQAVRFRVAAGYASDLRQACAVQARHRSDANLQRMRAAMLRAIAGVLTYSEVRDDIDLAIAALEDHDRARQRRRLEADVDALREEGATITQRAITAVVDARTRASVKYRLGELDAARQRAGLPALP